MVGLHAHLHGRGEIAHESLWCFRPAVPHIDRQGSHRAVLALAAMGLDVWMVTGDNRRVATALGRRLGIPPDRVMSEVLPADKARKVLLYLDAVLLRPATKKKEEVRWL